MPNPCLMLSLPKKTFHALEAVLFIALSGAQAAVSAKEIAARQGVPPRYLEQLLQKLVRQGILRGVRGPRGGYVLARERRRVNLIDICAALEGEGEVALDTPLAAKVIAPVWREAEMKMQEVLGRVTLADLAARAEAQKVALSARETGDFSI